MVHPVRAVDAACRRCGNRAAIQGRNEPLCQACFVSYIHTKAVKRLDEFRVKNASPNRLRTLLLPLSLGVTSLSLLYILDVHLQSQIDRTGRTGFHLHVLVVRLPSWADEKTNYLLQAIQERFPRYTYSSVSLIPGHNISGQENGSDEAKQAINIGEDSNQGYPVRSSAALLSSIPSVTSRIDILNILRIRVTVGHALESACEGILWGDSTTRLAEKVLAETAKGRGFSLPWQVSDGDTSWGIPFYYPMRDLLKKELLQFSDFVQPSLESLIYRDPNLEYAAPVASKNGSIDVLMNQYFESVEEQYPSIVANVVRTTGKLQTPSQADCKTCKLCKMRFDGEATTSEIGPAISQSIAESDTKPDLCYGCIRAVPPECHHLIPD